MLLSNWREGCGDFRRLTWLRVGISNSAASGVVLRPGHKRGSCTRSQLGDLMDHLSEVSAQDMLALAFAANTLLYKCVLYNHAARRVFSTLAAQVAVLAFVWVNCAGSFPV